MKRRGLVSIISKYLFLEALYPFAFALFGLCVFFLSSVLYEVADMLISKKIPLHITIQALVFRLPYILVYAFPISALFATLFALGRLVKDNEMIFIRMSGYGLFRIFVPFIIFGLLISFGTLWMNEEVVPWAYHRSMNLLRMVFLKDVTPAIRENVFIRGPEDRYFYVGLVDRQNQVLHDIMIYEVAFSGTQSPYPRVISAKKGTFHDDIWELHDGVIHEYDYKGYIQSESKFQVMTVPVGDGLESYFGNQKTTDEMSRGELLEEINQFLKNGIRIDSFVIDYHLKIAKPFASLIFILVAVPLSMLNRKGWVLGIIFTIILAFGYYILQSLMRSFAISGFLPPFWAAWLPNILFAVIGFVLMVREEYFIRG